jgi:DNA-directed RNA polymerase subunit RPC12/RpoP
MPTTSLLCDNCGAPLDVPDTARYATCGHCGSRLAVQRNATAAWTEVAERIAGDTGRINEGVTLLTLQAELERLDREWEMQQGKVSRRGKDGKPETAVGAFIGLLVPLFVLYMIFGKGELAPTIVLLAILAIGALAALRSGAIARILGSDLTESDYQRRRAELVHRIEERGGTL